MKRLIKRSLSIGASLVAGLIVVELLFAQVAALQQVGEERIYGLLADIRNYRENEAMESRIAAIEQTVREQNSDG
jgi:hypothetical protein